MKQTRPFELKFRDGIPKGVSGPSSGCGCSGTALDTGPASRRVQEVVPEWVTGEIITPARPVKRVSTELSRSDFWEHFRCRTTAFRESYTVEPGLYAAGNPGRNSDVLVSANYKFSFDLLRKELKGLDVWVLVLDTKGINVWCAAGKGTFGTAELVKRIGLTNLSSIVDHKRIIVPQLGAPGVSAHLVTKATGFRVYYGPVLAKDIPAYIRSGYKATREMRKITFGFFDRLSLTPMEINPAMKKYPLYGLIMLVIFGLSPSGIMFRDAFTGAWPFLVLGMISVLSGALLAPALLPFIPFRSFAIKGWLLGALSVILSIKLFPQIQLNTMLLLFTFIFFPMASSYITLQFTGATTFTGMSGVKKELRVAIPTYIIFGAISSILLIAFKLSKWRIL